MAWFMFGIFFCTRPFVQSSPAADDGIFVMPSDETSTVSCTSDGMQYISNESWRKGSFQYKCQPDGGVKVTACLIDGTDELQVGQTLIKDNNLHRCFREGDKVKYRVVSCGARGVNCYVPMAAEKFPSDKNKILILQQSETNYTEAPRATVNYGDDEGCAKLNRKYGETWTSYNFTLKCAGHDSVQVVSCLTDSGAAVPIGSSKTVGSLRYVCKKQSDGSVANLIYGRGGGGMPGSGGQQTNVGTSMGVTNVQQTGTSNCQLCQILSNQQMPGQPIYVGQQMPNQPVSTGQQGGPANFGPYGQPIGGGGGSQGQQPGTGVMQMPDGQLVVVQTGTNSCPLCVLISSYNPQMSNQAVDGQQMTMDNMFTQGGGMQTGSMSTLVGSSVIQTSGTVVVDSCDHDDYGKHEKHKVGEIWTRKNLKFSCNSDGSLAVLGCVTDAGNEIALGKDDVIDGNKYQCLHLQNGGAAYFSDVVMRQPAGVKAYNYTT